MILLVPILLYIILIVVLVKASKFLFASKVLKKIQKRITLFGTILFFPLGFLYFTYLLDIAFEDHRNVKRGTFLWYATMYNTTITDFPILEVEGEIVYNKIGGDSPNIGAGWEIKYVSKSHLKVIIPQILSYLKNEGYQLKKIVADEWIIWQSEPYNNKEYQLYTGGDGQRRSIHLMIKSLKNGTSKVQCTILE